jgi:tRNA U34 2-thiouridine synthase MnmA/TrmU
MLLSGGLDSVAALAWARREGYTVEAALSDTYGQRRARDCVRDGGRCLLRRPASGARPEACPRLAPD